MRRAVVGFVFVVVAAATGCAVEGPEYRITQVVAASPAGTDATVVLAKQWTQYSWWLWGDEVQQRHQYYLAKLDLAADGRITASDVRDLGEDDWRQETRYQAVADNCSNLLASRENGGVEIFRLRRGDGGNARRQEQTLARVRPDPAMGMTVHVGRALTRSGRHLLLADDRGVRILETQSDQVIDEFRQGPLVEVRRALLKHFGAAGTWWLSDDLRFVIVAPPLWVYEPGLMSTPEDTPVHLLGMDLHLQRQGLVFDRSTGRATAFATEIKPDRSARWWTRISDAESIDGDVLLLYGPESSDQHKTLLIVRPSAQIVAAHVLSFASEQQAADFHWSPRGGCMHVLEAPGWSKVEGRFVPDWRVHVCKGGAQCEVQVYRITNAQLQGALAHARR